MKCLHCDGPIVSEVRSTAKWKFCSYECRKASGVVNWYDMLRRCYNPAAKFYDSHGAYGVGVCERWRESYENFLEDMGPKPGAGYSVDRYPNQDGNYEPGNCRWATPAQQCQNKRTNVLNWDLVHEIRGRYEHGEGLKSIADRLSLKYIAVWKVANNRQWVES